MRFRISVINHANILIRATGLDKMIEEVMLPDIYAKDGRNLKTDFKAKLVSGKQLNVEG